MRFTTLPEWLAWQETCHPSEIDLGLERVQTVYQRLVTKPIARKIITVAGTNGKGSSVCFLESIYRNAAYRVASYTSPHIINYNDRIRINGSAVTDQDLCDVFNEIDQARTDQFGTVTSITYFEFATLAALLLMSKHDLDIAILEVGLGGRLDAVNIIDTDVALITAIDIDHEEWLGSDKEKIAIEKAGIMRPDKPVVCSDATAPKSIAECAINSNATLLSLDKDFNCVINELSWQWHGPSSNHYALPFLPLKGLHQYNNMAGVLMVLEILQDEYPVTQNQLRQGILASSIHGRLETIPGKINTLIDVAHNPQSTQALVNYLTEYKCSGVIRIVTGMMADKNIRLIIEKLTNICESWYVTDLPVARAILASDLIEIITTIDSKTKCFSHTNANLAYQQAVNDSQDNDQIVIFGSFHLVSEFRDVLSEQD
jgi:dihydrofolate synthase/folylpolyglutamate synthase